MRVEIPPLTDLVSGAVVLALPLVTRFRGIDVREVLLLEGPQGWTEFSPFTEYDDREASSWLRAAIEFGWHETPPVLRDTVRVNATVPAVAPEAVAGILERFPGCRTAKVKVGGAGTTLQDDAARVQSVREHFGPEGRIRVDANASWNIDEAEHAIRVLSEFDLEYVEQPCATLDELAEVRARVKYLGVPIAADESVRKAADPLAVARAGAADLLIVKAQPLGGIRSVLALRNATQLPMVVSSALETSVGIAMGAYLAAAMPDLEYDCGLATVSLLAADVADQPLVPIDGAIEVRRVQPNTRVFKEFRASSERRQWWLDRLGRCLNLLTATAAG